MLEAGRTLRRLLARPRRRLRRAPAAMSTLRLESRQQQTRQDWNARARANALHYIARVLRPGGLFKFQTRTLTGEPTPLWVARTRIGTYTWRLLARLIAPAGRRVPGGLDEGVDELKGGRYQSWVGNAIPIPQLRAT